MHVDGIRLRVDDTQEAECVLASKYSPSRYRGMGAVQVAPGLIIRTYSSYGRPAGSNRVH